MCNTFMVLCNRHFCLVPKDLIPPPTKETLYSLHTNSPTSFQPLVLTRDGTLLGTSYEWNLTGFVLSELARVTEHRFQGPSLCWWVLELPSFLWKNNIPLQGERAPFVHSSADGDLDCSHHVATVTNAAPNIHVRGPTKASVFTSLGCIPGGGVAGF